jgi:hypothetical protein
MAVSPTTPEYLNWSKVLITFDHSDYMDYVPKPGRYPLIINPIIKNVKLNRVLVAVGSSLNMLFLKKFNQMGLSRSALCPSRVLAVLKPNRIMCKHTDANCSSFHLRVFLGLSNPQGQRQISTISIPRDNFRERKAKFNLEMSRTTQKQLYKCLHVP